MEIVKITLEDRRVLYRSLGEGIEVFDFVRPPKKDQERDWEFIIGEELVRRSGLKRVKLYLRLVPDTGRTTKPFKIHPYVIGALLGDGALSGRTITIGKPYPEFIERVRSLLPNGYAINQLTDVIHSVVGENDSGESFRKLIEQLGLYQTKAANKFIPHCYMEGDETQRLELLKGLLDSDGSVGTNKSVSFYSASPSLALGVMYLVWSLGGIAKTTTSTRETKVFDGKEKPILTEYRVRIKYPRPWELFTIHHKARHLADGTRFSQNPKIQIASVELVEVDEDFICTGGPFHYGGHYG